MSSFAASTNVSPEQSQADIQKVLRRYGATRFGVMTDDEKGYVMFEYNGLMIQMNVKMPSKDDPKFQKSDAGRQRKPEAMLKEYEQDIRTKWRALLLCIKAKLEAVQTGISTIEKEFLAFVVMANGQSLGDQLIPQLEQGVKSGKMPKMLQLGMG